MQAAAEATAGREVPGRKGRRVGIRKVPMKRVFAGAYLDQGRKPREKLKTKSDIARYLSKQARLDLGQPIKGPSPEGDEKIAKMMAAEVAAAVARPGVSSVHWYSEAIERAIGIASVMHPEISSDEAAAAVPGARFRTADEARIVFFAATAITSQNVPVSENIRYALEQYRHYVEHGRFLPKGYGTKGQSMVSNLLRFNQLLELFDGDVGKIGDFLDRKFTMGELRTAASKVGIKIGGKELIDEEVRGSMLFGPKIGNGFYQNLRGNFSTLTVDLWMMRTFGRYTGTLLKGETTHSQVERLAEGLRGINEALTARMQDDGIHFEADALHDMEPEELLDLCRSLSRFWERMRKAMAAQEGETNGTLSAYKAMLDWPGAAEAISEALGDPVDQPTSPSMRRWIRSVVDRAVEILDSNGIVMQSAQLQATLWFPEKDLYNLLAGRKKPARNIGYDDALYDTARREGHSHESIEAQLLSLGAHGYVGRWSPEAAGSGEPGAVQRDGPGAAEGVGRPEGTGSEVLEVGPSEASPEQAEPEETEDEAEAEPVEEAPPPSFSPR